MNASDAFEIIHTYTRKEAIEDGTLVEVDYSKGAGLYRHPVAITAALHARLRQGAGSQIDTYDGRIWDVCWMSVKASESLDPSRVKFPVWVGREKLELWAVCGPDDDAEPCITIGFPGDF